MRTPRYLASVSSIAMLGALGLSGASLTAQATTFPVPFSSSETDGRNDGGLVPDPGATCAAIFSDHGNSVLSQVVDNADGTFTYGYRVCNQDAIVGVGPEFIRDWEIPWFWDGQGDPLADSEMGVSQIFVPEGWAVTVEQRDMPNEDTGWDGVIQWQDENNFWNQRFDNIFGEDNNPYDDHEYVLHFFTCAGFEAECFFGDNPIPPPGPLADPNSRAGFGLVSIFGETAAPHQASFVDLVVRTGDPDIPANGGQPLTPTILAAFNNIPPRGVPEPGSLALLGAGLGALGAAKRRRKKGSDT